MQFTLYGGELAETRAYAALTEVTLDLATGAARQRQVADVRHKFPTVPASLLGAQAPRHLLGLGLQRVPLEGRCMGAAQPHGRVLSVASWLCST